MTKQIVDCPECDQEVECVDNCGECGELMCRDCVRFHRMFHRMERPTPRDWKGIAAFVTALVGALGFAWNLMEERLNTDDASLIRQSMYEPLRAEISECNKGLEKLEGRIDAVLQLQARPASSAKPPSSYNSPRSDRTARTTVGRRTTTAPTAKATPPPPRPPPRPTIKAKRPLPAYQDLVQHVQQTGQQWDERTP